MKLLFAVYVNHYRHIACELFSGLKIKHAEKSIAIQEEKEEAIEKATKLKKAKKIQATLSKKAIHMWRSRHSCFNLPIKNETQSLYLFKR